MISWRVILHLASSQVAQVERRYLNLLIAFESALILLLTALAVQLRNAGNLFSYRSGLKEYILLAAFPVIWLVCLSLFGSWDKRILDNHIDGYRLVMGASTFTFLAFCSTSYLFKIQVSRFVILFSLIGGTLLLLLLRWCFLRFAEKKLHKSFDKQRWLALNNTSEGKDKVILFASEHNATIHHYTVNHSNFLTWVGQVVVKIREDKISRVVLVESSNLQPIEVQQLMWAVQQAGAEFVAYDILGIAASQSRIKYYDGLNWKGIGEPRINESLRVIKRLFDLTLVIPAIILLSPVFVVISILIKISSPGDIFYIQQRIGQNGKLFTFPKFRTMKKGADLERLTVVGRPDENMPYRYKNDPRITPIGKFLRRFSLDELPQLWCVATGTMSLVGPRPILPEEEPQLRYFHFRRHIAKPGLTGIWQVSGRKETTWDDRMAFDIKYVEDWSISLDLILIARTFKAIISGKGAY
jgi:exopolysaccharide biosynthesis polyprenyl glycosylphosphotransferase